MDVYLPIANLSVNGLVIVALGAITGILSGLFGVGGAGHQCRAGHEGRGGHAAQAAADTGTGGA